METGDEEVEVAGEMGCVELTIVYLEEVEG